MHFFAVSSFLLSVVLQIEVTCGNQKTDSKSFLEIPLRPSTQSNLYPHIQNSLREKRSPAYRIPECVFVTSEENRYFYKATADSDKVCGFYIFTDPDKVIEIHFEHFDVPCENGGLVSFVDGWELNGQFFPGIQDSSKSFEDRYQEFCGVNKFKKVLVTSQNAGMLHYRMPQKNAGFVFNVKFVKTPTPCNVLVESKAGVYTLKNYGKATNCSLMAVFPAKVKILALNVGIVGPERTAQMETGTIRECDRKGVSDRLEVGGSEGLDPSKLNSFENICGLDSVPEVDEMTIACGVTTVRLISSGGYDNSATFAIGQPDEEELLESSFGCEI